MFYHLDAHHTLLALFTDEFFLYYSFLGLIEFPI